MGRDRGLIELAEANLNWDGRIMEKSTLLLVSGLNEIVDLSCNLNQSQDTALRPNQLHDADGNAHYSEGIWHRDDNRWHQ